MAPSVAGPALPTAPLQSSFNSPSYTPSYRCKYLSSSSTNTALSPQTLSHLAPQLRAIAVQQLICNWQKYKNLDNSSALWGDELEYQLVKMTCNDDNDEEENVTVEPLLEQARVLKTLAAKGHGECFQAEYAKFQIESNPEGPYGEGLDALCGVERNMAKRRKLIQSALGKDEKVLTLTASPTFNLNGTSPEHIISTAAPAYSLARKNQLSRQGHDWSARVPLFQDSACSNISAQKDKHLILEDLSYGVSQCCMQITLQAQKLAAARHLYDQFIPLSPIMLALTAATPIYKSRLVDTDTRWGVMTALFDERSEHDIRIGKPLQSRWSANSTYMNPPHEKGSIEAAFGAKDMKIDFRSFEALRAAGMDEAMATHFAHIFNWDPLKLTTSDISLATSASASDNTTNLFDLYNNSHYAAVRFKPPPGGANTSQCGWRVEFRSMEVQPTDFENASFACFVVLCAKVIEEFGLRLYIPVEKVWENFEMAGRRGAAEREKFWWRVSRWCGVDGEEEDMKDDVYGLLSIDEIINGHKACSAGSSSSNAYPFPGFIPLINLYLARQSSSMPSTTYAEIQHYLSFISARANGRIPTRAPWMRSFVRDHPAYRNDGVVAQRIVRDMLEEIERVPELITTT